MRRFSAFLSSPFGCMRGWLREERSGPTGETLALTNASGYAFAVLWSWSECAAMQIAQTWKRVGPHVAVVAIALGGIVVLVACGDDPTQRNPPDAGPIDDLNPCWLQVANDVAGAPCTRAEECPNGTACVADREGGGICAAVCLPTTCPQACPANATCSRLAGGGGATLMLDLNRDGVAEEVGACLVPHVGVREEWEACGGNDTCVVDAVCSGFAGLATATCLPRCLDACPAVGGYFATCVAAGNADVCVIFCDPADAPQACPLGLSCATFPTGRAVCMR